MRLRRLFGINGSRLGKLGGAAAMAAIVAAITGTIAIAFAALSAHIALSRYYAPEIAALMVAGGGLLIAVVASLIVHAKLSRARREFEAQLAASAAVALAPTAFALARKHTGLLAVAAALGAGFWMARRTHD